MWCNKLSYGCIGVVLLLCWISQSCNGSESFGFKIHHRFSDPVKAMFNGDDQYFPEKGTPNYYAAMFHRDRVFHGRRLAGETSHNSTLTFASGNTTFRIDTLGFLYYANVSVGTPESWYLVALDTGSHLFWLPCDCAPNCLTRLQLRPDTPAMNLNIYSPRSSSTGAQLSCTSPYCENSINCAPTQIHCPYGVSYLSANTSSSGYLVEDVLHLTTNSNSSALFNVRIPFGCGVVQTGSFLRTAAPNGLLGLSMDPISLPNILASQGLTSNSYSMCFTGNGVGTILFGDRDSNEQGETPLNPNDRLNLYNISITHISMGTNVSATNFTTIFDSGTSITHLTDPSYSILSQKFNSQVKDQKVDLGPDIPFEFCYESNVSIDELIIPSINLTLSGGDTFTIIDPVFVLLFQSGRTAYCLGVAKSDIDEHNINIIGENFMSGYRIVFDHERMVLGWKAHDCGEVVPLSPRPSMFRPPGLITPSPSSSVASALGNGHRHSYLFICILLVQLLSIQLMNP
ncbi:aspartyl protease family protein 1-like [Amaranthus tricolor]|uniref:aspartyl protease family protein 1-like n=1 Tax=Amaranthus tricolor TaxID=29722 RepID=UPI00258551A2|nr:aspartyl protease family protein 1-like [Amaranthus tricolor]